MLNLNKKPYKLMYGHLGNGITVCNTKEEKHGDYVKVAHIAQDRKVKFYEQLPVNLKNEILDYAKTGNPEISATQSQKVFTTKYYA